MNRLSVLNLKHWWLHKILYDLRRTKAEATEYEGSYCKRNEPLKHRKKG